MVDGKGWGPAVVEGGGGGGGGARASHEGEGPIRI